MARKGRMVEASRRFWRAGISVPFTLVSGFSSHARSVYGRLNALGTRGEEKKGGSTKKLNPFLLQQLANSTGDSPSSNIDPEKPISKPSGLGSKKGTDGAPFRHSLAWNDPNFYNQVELDKEMRRVFDVCHGCRLCFNLCNSFPRLFELIDGTKSGELDEVPSSKFKSVVDDCTLCDMCFIAKCPYVPPHPFSIDFPHLMLRYRIVENNQNKISGEALPDRKLSLKGANLMHKLSTDIDRVGSLASKMSPVMNWVTKTGDSPRLTRKIMEKTMNLHVKAVLPSFVTRNETFLRKAKSQSIEPNPLGPSFGKRKVLIYGTCLVNYNKPNIGMAARRVLSHTGVHTEVSYPQCCGMPQLESGDIKNVTARAINVANHFKPYLDDGYDIVSLVPSCSLMLKQEWPNFLPNDPIVQKLASRTFDLSEYIVLLSKKEGLIPGLKPLEQSITLHHACHARAQNMGFKARDMLKLIPGIKLSLIEKCSGHGGSFGTKKETHSIALAVGKPVFDRVSMNEKKEGGTVVSSECPLAADHILQGVRELDGETSYSKEKSNLSSIHPIELMAQSYGLSY